MQIWVADVKRKNELQSEYYGRIVLKCFQVSLLPHPEPTWLDPISEYECRRQLVGVEDLVYTTLERYPGICYSILLWEAQGMLFTY